MNWIDLGPSIEIHPPKEFNFAECLVYLGRSELESLHRIKDGCLYKLIEAGKEKVLLKIGSTPDSIQVQFPISVPSASVREQAAAYTWDWFDLNQNLADFYEAAGKDTILKPIVERYYGLRMIGIPDLFEALTWAIIGQQINLTFAYTLKKRLVELFGESLTFEGDTYWLFPTCETIARLQVEDLRKLQFSGRKAEYIIGIAKAMSSGELSKEKLLHAQEFSLVHQSLVSIRGVGAWTADYVMMKCLHERAAFPIADVGLHQALMLQLGLAHKPAIEEIRAFAANWEGWQAYATFYLWRSLYD